MKWKEEALLHAETEDPKESVGLLLNVKGKKVYFPCKNVAGRPKRSFILDQNDYLEATKKGQVVAVIHSHPNTPPIATQADKMNCEKHGIPWYIINPRLKTWGEYKPEGYKAPLIGREYSWGIADCWSIVTDFYEQEFKTTLDNYPERPNNVNDFSRNPFFESNIEAVGFSRISGEEPLKKGDIIFMSLRSPGLNHCAIYIENGMILHHLTDRLSCREEYNKWYQKCTGAIYRYAK